MGVYNRTKRNALEGDLTLDSSTIKCLLLKSSAPVFNPDHNFVADLVPGTNEITGGSYARLTLSSKTFAQVDASDWAEARNNELTFLAIAVGQTVGAAVVYREVTNDADSVLVGHYELADTPGAGLDMKVQFDGTATAGAFLRARQAA